MCPFQINFDIKCNWNSSLFDLWVENMTYFAVIVVSVFPHQVHTMAVFIPERSLVGQSAVGDGDVIVMVIGGEGPVLVIRQGIT